MTHRKIIPLRREDEADPVHSISDDALVAACARGDIASLGTLYDRHHVSVYRFLARIAGARSSDLDDLVQTTFIDVARAAPGFRERSSVRTWIFGIAANVARHHARSEGRRRTMLTALEALPRTTLATPDVAAERRELAERVEAAVVSLPIDQRVAFVMCHLEEVSGPEAARVLGVREGTLAWRLHEARKVIKTALRGEGGDHVL